MNLKLFQARPGLAVVVLPDPPTYTIVAVSDDFVRMMGMSREQIIGRGHLDLFPANPDDPDFTGEQNIRLFYEQTLAQKLPQELLFHRYDIQDKKGAFTEKYWKAKNTPVLDENGEVEYIIHTAEDITSQVKAEQRSASSKGIEKAYSLFMQAPVVIGTVKGRNHILELANEEALKLWGKPKGIIGKPVLEAIPELKDQGVTELFDLVLSTGKTYRAKEAPIASYPNGVEEINYFDLVYQPYYDEGSNIPVGVFTLSHNVTEQVLARQKAEQSEQQIRALVESAPFPIGVYIGKEMRIALANQSIIEAWGKGPDVIGKLYSEVNPELGNQEIFSQLDQVYTTGVSFHAINQRVDIMVDGILKPFYFKYSFTPLLDGKGKVYGVMNTAADVTDLMVAKQKVEQSEKNFRQIILQSPVAMCILIGPDHIVDIANEAMIALWGKPVKDVMHKPIFEGLPDAREQGLEQLLSDVYNNSVPFKASERPVELIRNGKRETVYQNFVYEPYKDAEGKTIGVLAISIDVTDRVMARQKIEEVVIQRTAELANAYDALMSSNQELKRTNINLEEFAYAASHDLKEPTRKINIFAKRLKDSLSERLTENEKKYFERMEQAALRMSTLIDDLLTYSEVSQKPMIEETVDLNLLIEQVLSDLDLEIEQKCARIEVGELFTMKGHGRQLQQAFQNLIGNALKYSREDVPPEIRINGSLVKGTETNLHLAAEDQDKYFNKIVISDNGIGFERSDAERIFNVFTRLHDTSKYKGTGVGLSIVRKVVKNHGGYIYADSNPGKGAFFTMLLPVAH